MASFMTSVDLLVSCLAVTAAADSPRAPPRIEIARRERPRPSAAPPTSNQRQLPRAQQYCMVRLFTSDQLPAATPLSRRGAQNAWCWRKRGVK